jgi:hypothetical protein
MATNKSAIVFVLLFISGMAVSFQRPEISQVYNSQLGVQEQPLGSNWGPQVKGYLASVKVYSPAPWCAAYVHWCLDSAGHKNTITAYSPSAQNKANLVYYNSQILQEIKAGDVFTVYFIAMGRIGHTGFVGRRINQTVIETNEGNSNPGGSREGYGVFKRKRSIHSLYSISRW